MAKMKLKEWADKHGLSYLTANRHFHAGMIPNAIQLESGTILVEDESPEQNMIGNTPNDAISLFLKKTVEFSKNNSTVEDFAAFVISNFQLKINNVSEGPRYSKQKPKSEEVQKHFQQFIPKNDKPKPNSFVMEPEAFDDIPDMQIPNTAVNHEDLVKDFTQAVNFGSVVAPRNYLQDLVNTSVLVTSVASAEAMSAEGTVTQSVDLNSTPQPINYTGSNNLAFSSSLSSGPVAMANGINSFDYSSIPTGEYVLTKPTFLSEQLSTGGLYFNHNTDDLHLPNQVRLQSSEADETSPTTPRRKRGRKPSKR